MITMKEAFKSILRAKTKKVQLSDIASPQPSRAAARVLNGAMKRAHADQMSLSRRAQALRTN